MRTKLGIHTNNIPTAIKTLKLAAKIFTYYCGQYDAKFENSF